ncbi:unnamed protein product, partial [Bubo scandiacus]
WQLQKRQGRYHISYQNFQMMAERNGRGKARDKVGENTHQFAFPLQMRFVFTGSW